MLKLNPLGEPECEHEADALAFWDGHGAVRLLARDAHSASFFASGKVSR